MGIEPTCSAWKADILPLNYTRIYSVLMPYYYNTCLCFCQAFSEIFFKFTITDIFFAALAAFAGTMHKKEHPKYLSGVPRASRPFIFGQPAAAMPRTAALYSFILYSAPIKNY